MYFRFNHVVESHRCIRLLDDKVLFQDVVIYLFIYLSFQQASTSPDFSSSLTSTNGWIALKTDLNSLNIESHVEIV